VAIKTYIATSVMLYGVPDEHRAANGNCQYTIVVRAKNQKRVVELIGGGCTLAHLRDFCGIHLASDKHLAIPQKDEVIYYSVERAKQGYVGKWFEYEKKESKNTSKAP